MPGAQVVFVHVCGDPAADTVAGFLVEPEMDSAEHTGIIDVVRNLIERRVLRLAPLDE